VHLHRLLGVAEEIGAGENRVVYSATDRNLMLRQVTLTRLDDGSYCPVMSLAIPPVDPQLARWIGMRRQSKGLPPGGWTSGWLMHRVLTRGDARGASAPATRSDRCPPPRPAPDHRSYAGEAAPASSGSGAQPEMPTWWADVPWPLKSAYWYVRLLGGDPLLLVAIAQDLATPASANAFVDQHAAQATTVAPEPAPVVVQPRRGRLTTEHRGSGDSKPAARRGRRPGPAWGIEQQLVDDLVAGIVDMRARRPVIAAHARALLTARGFRFRVDYSRPALDGVVRAAVTTALAIVRTRA
jgi:hypothetical protein